MRRVKEEAVLTNGFDAEQVLAVEQTARDSESCVSLVNEEVVRAPLMRRAIITVLPDLNHEK